MCINITNITDHCRVEILQGVAYCPVFLIGFLVNAAALRVFIAKRDSWTDTHIYMFNLVIADSALVLFLPFKVYDSFFCLPKTEWCTLLMNIHYVNMYASIMTTTAISVQRYLVIRFPLQARTWRKKKEAAFAVCLVFWGLLVLLGFVFHGENDLDKLWTCYDRCKNDPLRSEVVVTLLVPGFLIPLLIIAFCTGRILCVLSTVDDISGEKKSIVGIVAANLVVFFVCYTPIHIAFLINLDEPTPDWYVNHSTDHLILLVAEWIAATNCCFDSVSYYFLLKEFYS